MLNDAKPFFSIKSSEFSITLSNIKRYCNLTFLLLVFIYICSLEWFVFSRSSEFTYPMNCFRFLFVSSLLLTGHFPTLSTLFFRISLSFFSPLHWNIRWSTDAKPYQVSWLRGIRIFNPYLTWKWAATPKSQSLYVQGSSPPEPT